MIAVTILATMIAFVPLVLAWRASTNIPGTTEDADFYLLLQTAIMQLLGIFTALYPSTKGRNITAWIWAQAFAIGGALCTVGSVPMYLYLPTMWSALASFFGAVAQVVTTLQLALMSDAVLEGLKED